MTDREARIRLLTRETGVYRLWGAEGALLYAGTSVRPEQRIREHRSDKRWGAEVTRAEIVWHPDRATALHAEADIIRNECPRYNIVIPTEGGLGGRMRHDAPAEAWLGGAPHWETRRRASAD